MKVLREARRARDIAARCWECIEKSLPADSLTRARKVAEYIDALTDALEWEYSNPPDTGGDPAQNDRIFRLREERRFMGEVFRQIESEPVRYDGCAKIERIEPAADGAARVTLSNGPGDIMYAYVEGTEATELFAEQIVGRTCATARTSIMSPVTGRTFRLTLKGDRE